MMQRSLLSAYGWDGKQKPFTPVGLTGDVEASHGGYLVAKVENDQEEVPDVEVIVDATGLVQLTIGGSLVHETNARNYAK